MSAKSLLEQTYALLDRDERSIAALHDASNLPYHWLRKMKSHAVANPGVRTVEKLLRFLETGERAN